jgi:hydroxylysine kinase
MKTLHKNHITCPTPIASLNGNEFFKITKNYELSSDSSLNLFVVRLLTFIPGKPIDQIKSYTKELLFNVGKYAANLDLKLKEFYDPVYEQRDCIWRLDKIGNYMYRLESIADTYKREVLREILKNFCSNILSKENASFLQKGMIHGDFNETNILIDIDKEDTISGILDFGDTSHSYYIFEVAICAVYMMLDSIKKSIVSLNQIEAGGYVIAGYLSSFKLSEKEFYLILDCIKARLVQSLMNGCYESKKSGDDGYVLITQQSGWDLLCLLQDKGEEKIYQTWLEILYINKIYLK